jgi:predicted nucleic acid-binding protein
VKILIDTDILIDVALNRAPHANRAGRLLDCLERNDASGFMAWHSASNFYYLVSPKRGKQDTRSFLLELTDFVEIASCSTESLRQAARLDLKDFEDAMQVAAALACGADVIATRNVRDYVKSPIEAATPGSILKSLAIE